MIEEIIHVYIVSLIGVLLWCLWVYSQIQERIETNENYRNSNLHREDKTFLLLSILFSIVPAINTVYIVTVMVVVFMNSKNNTV